MEKKKISINPDFFSLRKRRKGKQKKEKPVFKKSLKTNEIKKQLLTKIKLHQQKEQKKKLTEQELIHKKKFESNIDKEVINSIEYLNSINKKNRERKKTAKRKKKSLDQNLIINTTPFAVTNQNIVSSKNKTEKKIDYSIRPDPPYGILKSGKKPLYRNYMQSLKKKHNPIQIHTDKNDFIPKIIPQNIIDRQKKLKKLRKKFKVRKRKFTLGKNLRDRTVNILVKNRTAKKRTQKHLDILKKESIYDIKKYLRNHGLLKIGTFADEDVIRQIYLDSKSAGYVFNRSQDILLHNYLNDKK